MRMDERLMQLVRLSDSLMRGDRGASGRSLHARPFGMTPLGPRLGLVQWVEHSVPIFQVRCLLRRPARVQRGFRAPHARASEGARCCSPCCRCCHCSRVQGLLNLESCFDYCGM